MINNVEIKEPVLVSVIRRMFDFLFWVLTRAEYYGLENVPSRGPFLMVTNHLSYVDAPFIMVSVRRKGMVALAADTYKKHPLFGRLVETAGGVWVNRGAGDRGAIRAAMAVLKEGRILGMAPEGTRSRVTHALMRGKSGAAFIASKTGVPILPIGLTGTENVLSELKRLRRARITFTAGPVFTLPSLDSREDKGKAVDDYTHEIMCRIAVLLPENYQGVYRGDPRIKEVQQALSNDGQVPAPAAP